MNSPLRAAIFVIAVSFCHTQPVSAADWRVPRDFATIQEALDSVLVADGDRILVGPGSFAGADIKRPVHIQGTGGASITSGPLHASGMKIGFRLWEESDGTTISQFRFMVDLPIINLAFNVADNVTITRNTLIDPVQGITNWLGSHWQITQNDIVDLRTRCGGGIAILVGDYSGGVVSSNVVAHNRISGTVHVSPTDCGGYSATGIVLYADFRWGRAGSSGVVDNQIINNSFSLVSDTPAVVDVVAIELSEASDPDPLTDVIYDNAIGFNDLRGTTVAIALAPSDLDTVNAISRNLTDGTDDEARGPSGERGRGHGLHPSAFLED